MLGPVMIELPVLVIVRGGVFVVPTHTLPKTIFPVSAMARGSTGLDLLTPTLRETEAPYFGSVIVRVMSDPSGGAGLPSLPPSTLRATVAETRPPAATLLNGRLTSPYPANSVKFGST